MKRYVKSAITPVSDEPLDVQLEILTNPNTSEDVLWQFADSSPVIKADLAKNPGAPADLLRELYNTCGFLVKKSLASNPSTPSDILSELIDFFAEETSIKAKLAANPNLSAKDFTRLAEDSDWRVRIAITNNKHCPIEILTKLQNDAYGGVARNARNALWRMRAK